MKKKLYSFLLAAFLATTSLFAVDTTSDLKAHYTFESVDTVAGVPFIKDQSANSYDTLFVQGAVALGDGYGGGKSVILTDTTKILRAKNDILKDVEDFTVSYWINQNDYATWGRIFDFGSYTSNYMFMTCIDKKFRIAIQRNGEGEKLLTASFIMPTKQWIHVAVTADYTINAGVDTTSIVTMYIDGMLAGTSTEFKITPGMLDLDLKYNTYNVFGDSQYGDPTINSSLDDFRLYTRALTEEDLVAIHGFTAEFLAVYNALTLTTLSETDPESLVDVVDNLVLSAGSGNVTITWVSSDTTVISNDGVIKQDEYNRTSTTMTATVSVPDGPSIKKSFNVSVYPENTPLGLVAQWNFRTDSINRTGSEITIKDEGEVGFTATCKGNAQILPFGDGSEEGVDLFNVLVLDNTNNQYLDLGAPIGENIYKLNDYTVSIYYLRDTTNGFAAAWNYGMSFYAFGNANLSSNGWGAMYYEPFRARHVCTPDNYGSETSNMVGAGENITPKGKSWHNITYSQTLGTGVLYVDGVQKATAAMPNPKVALKTNSNVATFTGTPNNYVGRANYDNDSRAKNTYFYGLKLYAVGLSADDMEGFLNISATITMLNDATDNTTYDIQALTVLYPLLGTVRTTLATGFTSGEADLLVAYALGQADSTNRTPSSEHNTTIQDAVTNYTSLAANWVSLGTALTTVNARTDLTFTAGLADLNAAIDAAQALYDLQTVVAEDVTALNTAITTYDTRAANWNTLGKDLTTCNDLALLNYPGLATFQAAITVAQGLYDVFTVSADDISTLEAAKLVYYQTQVASSTKPADLTYTLTNPGFNLNATGGTKLSGSGTSGTYNLPKGWDCFVNNASWIGCNNYTSTPAEGSVCYEVWSGGAIAEVDFSQSSGTLAAGYYILSGDIRTTGADQAISQHVYATVPVYNPNTGLNDSLQTFRSDSLGKWGSYGWTLPAWKKVFVLFNTTGGEGTIGFHANNIIQMDNMRLAYYGATAPTTQALTSYLKNPGFEEGVNATELQGFGSTSAVKADLGDLFAPVSWTVLANVDTTANVARMNAITLNPSEGAKAYEMFADSINSLRLTQKIYAPVSGVYRMTADVRCDASSKSLTDTLHYDARLLAKINNQEVEGVKMAKVDSSKVHSADWNTSWVKLSLDFRASVSDLLELGLLSSSFVQVDNFTLDYTWPLPKTADKNIKVVSSSNKYTVYAKNGVINIQGLTNERVSLYDIAGRQISVKNASQISVSKGLYFVKINNEVTKVLVK